MNEVVTAEPMAIGDMAMSASIDKLAAALAKAQGEMGGAKKGSTNPHFRSTYADLASAREAYQGALSANGLSLIQSPSTRGTEGGPRVRVQTMLLHESGQYISGVLELVPTKTDPQGVCSAVTYARRYAAMAMTGIAPDDDDGNAASEAPQRQRQAPAPKRQLARKPARTEAPHPTPSVALTEIQAAIMDALRPARRR